MQKVVELTLPVPPSLNRLYRWSKNGVYMSQAGKDFKRLVAFLVTVRHPSRDIPMYKPEIPLVMHVRYHPKGKRRIDLDNLLKITLDAFQDAGVYNNDKQIEKIMVCLDNEQQADHIVVKIACLDNEALLD